MKAENFPTQRTLSSKDSQKFEMRKIRRKHVGEPLLQRVSSRDGAKALTNRDSSFLHKHKGSESGLGIFRTPVGSKNADKSKQNIERIPFNQGIENRMGGHRRTKTMGLQEQKKSNYGINENISHQKNLSTLSNNKKVPDSKCPKENTFQIDLKNVKTSSSNTRNSKRSNVGLVSERGIRNEATMKVKQALSSKFDSLFGKKKLNTDRVGQIDRVAPPTDRDSSDFYTKPNNSNTNLASGYYKKNGNTTASTSNNYTNHDNRQKVISKSSHILAKDFQHNNNSISGHIPSGNHINNSNSINSLSNDKNSKLLSGRDTASDINIQKDQHHIHQMQHQSHQQINPKRQNYLGNNSESINRNLNSNDENNNAVDIKQSSSGSLGVNYLHSRGSYQDQMNSTASTGRSGRRTFSGAKSQGENELSGLIGKHRPSYSKNNRAHSP